MATIVLPPSETFSTLQQALRSRCGFHATLGSAPALDGILTEANDYVYAQLDDGLPTESTVTVYANVPEYDFATDEGVQIARGSVQEVWIEQGDSSRVPLPQGISHALRADADLRSIPQAYDTKLVDGVFTLEVWPVPDQAYTLYIKHNRVLSRFTQPTDKPSAPARLVLSYAIAMGKAHYGKADAETSGAAFKVMLSKEKFKQKENRRFVPRSCDPGGARVVRGADGTFRQVR